MDRAATACKVLPFSQICQDLEEKSTAVVSTSSKMGLKCHINPYYTVEGTRVEA